jgi:hypothetical protein
MIGSWSSGAIARPQTRLLANAAAAIALVAIASCGDHEGRSGGAVKAVGNASASGNETTGEVIVVVKDIRGAPVPHAAVSLLVDFESASMRLQAETDDSGKAAFTSRAPARVRAYASNGASAGSTRETALSANGRIDLEIRVRPASDFTMLGMHSTGEA